MNVITRSGAKAQLGLLKAFLGFPFRDLDRARSLGSGGWCDLMTIQSSLQSPKDDLMNTGSESNWTRVDASTHRRTDYRCQALSPSSPIAVRHYHRETLSPSSPLSFIFLTAYAPVMLENL
jgi:hypothetical protein